MSSSFLLPLKAHFILRSGSVHGRELLDASVNSASSPKRTASLFGVHGLCSKFTVLETVNCLAVSNLWNPPGDLTVHGLWFQFTTLRDHALQCWTVNCNCFLDASAALLQCYGAIVTVPPILPKLVLDPSILDF
ncbi:unnamed protein product [Linum trigynum]|uniref:Uncharacterized protein n=1 Tax=Linum trigynum TaxID=586398 RepID=A0AAV2GI36_9ROSI